MTGIAPVAWRTALADLSDHSVTGLLTVQCATDWLRAEMYGMRDEVDEAVLAAVRSRAELHVDRLVLHSIPVLTELPPAELAALNAAHADWLHNLAAAAALLPAARRPRIHRLIVGGTQRFVGVVDGIALHRLGNWSQPDTAATALDIVRRGSLTTPLTGYDLDLDGPFGDTDPSCYL
ncbi:MAG: hypothetical protein M3Y33_16695 [Actinomycetota bacterium]|nr:hypothetical protein [Actinomycetota bacterium]